LGQYLLLDSDAGFLGLSNSNPFNQAQLIQFLRTGTDFLSGLGDLAEVIEPLKPVSDGVRQAGESLGEAIDQQSAVSSNDTTPFAQAEPGFLTVWEIIPASQQNSFRFRQLVTQQFLAVQGEGLALVSGEADAGSFVLQPASGCALFPEAELNATGTPFKGTTSNGESPTAHREAETAKAHRG